MKENLKLFSLLIFSKTKELFDFSESLFKNVYSYNDGLDGLFFLKNNPHIEIVLLDDDLSNIKGFELIEKIKKINKSIKVIMFSKNHDTHILLECLKFNIDYINIPFSNDFLLMKLLNISEDLIHKYEIESKLEELTLLKERREVSYSVLKIDQNFNNIYFNDNFLKMFPKFNNIKELFFSDDEFIDFSGVLIDVYRENFWKGTLVLKSDGKPLKVEIDIILRKNSLLKNVTYILIFKNHSSESCKNVKSHFLKKNSELFMYGKKIKCELELKLKKLENEYNMIYNQNELNLLKEQLVSVLNDKITFKNDKIKLEKDIFLLNKILKDKENIIKELESVVLEFKHQFLLINSGQYVDSLLSKIDFWRNKFIEIENKRGK